MNGFSVVIPLYNKADYILRAIDSALQQTLAPAEVIVVDDGSSDGGAEIVEALAAKYTPVRLIKQTNAGAAAARNLGVGQARSEFVAFLDADDWWEPGFLAEIASMIAQWPGCGIYCTGFRVHRRNKIFENDQRITTKGIVENYFREAFRSTICWTSAIVVPRDVMLAAGGFPVGMRRGQDLYAWTKIALNHSVCYSPERLSNYDVTVEGNSKRRYRLEDEPRSFLELMQPGNDDLNEYLARYQIGIAILQSVNGYTAPARQTERETAFTKRYRLNRLKLLVLNRMPVFMRKPALNFYLRAAALVSRKGMME